MKKIMILACVCMALVFSSCHREQHSYNASITECHFANHDNEVAAMAILKTFSSFWEGDYVWKGSVSVTDIKADIRFTAESNLAISTNFDNKLAEYFDEGDYFIYTLKRNDDNVILHQYKYTKDGGEEILDLVEEN